MRVIIFAVLLGIAMGCKRGPEPGTVAPSEADSTMTLAKMETAEYDSFGFRIDSMQVSDYTVQPNESLYLILDRLEFTPQEIYSITREAGDYVNWREFRPGQSYRIYASAGGDEVSRLIWQPNMLDYVVFELEDSLRIYKDSKEIRSETKRASAEITSSLYQAINDQGLSPVLAYKMSDIYAWQIDFFGLRQGDSFRVYYEDRYVGDDYAGIGEILAVEFTHRGEVYKAYQFESGEVSGYFNEEGQSVQKALLKAPFTYDQRISSHFNRNRFHPVLKRRMPHNGVDYAAPHGTPVLSTGDGTVLEAQYRGANGNIVKVRHNGTYETAYLHLSGFASGVRAGSKVKQGQVIGYVGRTGRVTGTHLHYQLLKNGAVVNPLTVDLPPSESVPESLREEFAFVQQGLDRHLNPVEMPQHPMFTGGFGDGSPRAGFTD